MNHLSISFQLKKGNMLIKKIFWEILMNIKQQIPLVKIPTPEVLSFGKQVS